MKCKECNGKTKVVDTRERTSNKARILVLRKVPSFRGEENINFRWRHRICVSCKKVSYSVECDLEDLRLLFEKNNEKDNGKSQI